MLMKAVMTLVLFGTAAFGQGRMDTPHLQGAVNFRDVAGTTSPDTTVTGQSLRPGEFYRANALNKLTAADAAALRKLNLALVVDLRTPCEIKGGCADGRAGMPDRPLTNKTGAVPDIDVNILGVSGLGSFNVSSANAADQTVMAIYMGFVLNASDRAAFLTALHDMAVAKGPVLFHCSAGKDRSGWMAVILQSIAGVPMAKIEQDYLASNQYEAREVAAVVGKMPAAQRPGWEELETVQPQFLNAAYAAVQLKYGNMDYYIRQGIGLSPADYSAIKAKLINK